MKNYIVVEIIPTTRNIETGSIAQLCAIKVYDSKIKKRLNLRLNKEYINIPDILNMINYDNDKFKYLESTNEIIDKFIKFCGKDKIIIIPNDYTLSYLSSVNLEKVSICDIVKIDYSPLLIDDIISKYNLKYSNDIVKILYDAIKNTK